MVAAKRAEQGLGTYDVQPLKHTNFRDYCQAMSRIRLKYGGNTGSVLFGWNQKKSKSNCMFVHHYLMIQPLINNGQMTANFMDGADSVVKSSRLISPAGYEDAVHADYSQVATAIVRNSELSAYSPLGRSREIEGHQADRMDSDGEISD